MSWNVRAASHYNFNQVDLSSLVKLDSYSDVSGSLVKDVIILYLETAPAQIKEIQDAVSSQSFEKINQIAHSLKSASGQIGAMKVSEACRELEEMTHHSPSTSDSLSQKTEKLASLFEELTLELKLVLKAVEDINT